MRPTPRAILVAAAGLPVALLPVFVARLWPLWPVFLAGFAVALGIDALLAPERRGVSATAALPEIGRAHV